jgi:hypothetical protein
LLKWLAPRKGYAFYSGAGENPRSNFLYRPPPIVARIEYVEGFQQPAQRKSHP